jgi:phenylalanyl-tRNA synthetase beta chain
MWMRLRLHAAGVRSINYWIDVSNYAQVETGQPMHFYDAKKVRGKTLAAREARAGETIRTLDGVERKLQRGVPVIADAQGPVGIAGVYGGADTAVSDATNELFLESASFVGPRIRRAAKDLGLRTEAGARHEKSLPLQLAEFGRRHAARLLVAAGATPSQVVVAGDQPAPLREVTVRPTRVNKVLGTDYSTAEIRKALEALAFAPSGTDAMRVTVPYWRDDVVEEIDLVEEVARAIGYDRIAERPAVAAPQSVDEGLFRQESLLANRTASLGYREVVTLGLQGSRVVAAWERSGIPFWSDASSVANPLSEDQRLLRPSLLPGLLAVAARAWPRVKEDVKFFELGHIFRTLEGKDLEWPSLGGLAVFADSREDTAIDARLRAVMGDAEALIAKLCGPADIRMTPKARAYFHPGASANMSLAGETVGKVGRLHPRLAHAYELPAQTYAFFLYLEKLSLEPAMRRFTPLPKFPGTQRDIAVVVNEDVAARDLVDAVNATRSPVVEKVTPFDEYRGPQVGARKKSIALRISLRKPDATITDAEADAALESIVAALAEKFGASLRGPAA